MPLAHLQKDFHLSLKFGVILGVEGGGIIRILKAFYLKETSPSEGKCIIYCRVLTHSASEIPDF